MAVLLERVQLHLIGHAVTADGSKCKKIEERHQACLMLNGDDCKKKGRVCNDGSRCMKYEVAIDSYENLITDDLIDVVSIGIKLRFANY